MQLIHRSPFLKELKAKYPELKGDLNAQMGLLAFEVSVFIEFIQAAIDKGDQDKVRETLELTSYYYLNSNNSLKTLLCNAVCEDLDFEDTDRHSRSWALNFLPKPLKRERDAWIKFMGGVK